LPASSALPASGALTALAVVNEATKFVVSFAALCVLLHFRNAAAAAALFGSILTSLAGKLLKRLLAHARPAGARKADPGMPSSHAVSLGYLATYAASALFASSTSRHLLWPAALQALGLALTALRVVLGYHTVPQVVVGYALGGCAAVALHWLTAAFLLPVLHASPHTLNVLYCLTGAAIAVFALAAARSWAEDVKHLICLTLTGNERGKTAPA
jgi:dolichyldiphosphatase